MIETLKQLSSRQKICRKLFLKILANLRGGRIVLRDADGFHVLGTADGRDGLQAEVTVRDPAFYCAAVNEQSAGVGRAFMEHWWDSPQLVDLIRIFARNEDVLRRWTAPTQGLLGLWHRYSFWRQRNSKSGSRRNISAHYDLGEDFFSEFLDPSLTYSCAFFEEEGACPGRGPARQAGPGLPQGGPAARGPPAGDRHRLGQPGDPRSHQLRLPGHHHDHQPGAGPLRPRQDPASGIVRPHHGPAPGLPRLEGPIRQADIPGDDRSGGREVLPGLFRQVRRPARDPTAPCFCRPSPSTTGSLSMTRGTSTSSNATFFPAECCLRPRSSPTP